jgi:hypothetical protein
MFMEIRTRFCSATLIRDYDGDYVLTVTTYLHCGETRFNQITFDYKIDALREFNALKNGDF